MCERRQLPAARPVGVCWWGRGAKVPVVGCKVRARWIRPAVRCRRYTLLRGPRVLRPVAARPQCVRLRARRVGPHAYRQPPTIPAPCDRLAAVGWRQPGYPSAAWSLSEFLLSPRGSGSDAAICAQATVVAAYVSRLRAAAATCGAAPPCITQTVPPGIASRRQRSPERFEWARQRRASGGPPATGDSVASMGSESYPAVRARTPRQAQERMEPLTPLRVRRIERVRLSRRPHDPRSAFVCAEPRADRDVGGVEPLRP